MAAAVPCTAGSSRVASARPGPPTRVHRLGGDDLASLLPLAQAVAIRPYRNYRAFSRTAQEAVLAAELGAVLATPLGAVYVDAIGAPRTAVVARRLPWESEFFGVEMARVEHVLGSDPEACAELLRVCLDELRDEGVQHVCARVDVADLATVGLLESHGFRLMETLLTYASHPRHQPSSAVRQFGRVRPMRAGDAAELVEIAEEAFNGFRGRFHMDANVPRDRADAFYVEWARQSVAGRLADLVLVAEGSDEGLLGFVACRRVEPTSSVTGVPVFGGGLGACRREGGRAYAGLIRAAIVWAHEHGGIVECQTQNYNFSSTRIFEALDTHYVRAEYTLHAWLTASRPLA